MPSRIFKSILILLTAQSQATHGLQIHNTQPLPVTIKSCSVSPSTIDTPQNESITFVVYFSARGYEFTAETKNDPPGQAGCSGTSGDNRVASCNGQSGLLYSGQVVNITITTSVGNCSVSYRSTY